MKYTSGRAFRQALEVHLREINRTDNIPIIRLRKHAAFERFSVRLQTYQPNTWILKGGLAVQLHLGIRSRTTRDIDFLNIEYSENIHNTLVEAASVDIGD